MTHSHDPDDRVKPAIPTEEYGAEKKFRAAGESQAEKGADYTTTGDPIDDPEHLAEENQLHATVGNPLSGADEVDDDVDRTTPGNPMSSAEHEVEEDLPHATPGNNPVIPED